jgi:two-component system, chemotaxis family, sensor kinase CheA
MPSPFNNETFASEAEELLLQIESATLALEANARDAENINLLFRALHTFKGSAAIVGLDAIASFAHHVETALDQVRSGKIAVTPELISNILACRDHIQVLLNAAYSGTDPSTVRARGDALVKQLSGEVRRVSMQPPAASPGGIRMRTTYAVSFRLERSEEGSGATEAELLEKLRELGACRAHESAPAEGNFGPRWVVELTTTADEDTIRDLFLLASPGSELKVESGLSEFVTDPPAAPRAASTRERAAPPAATGGDTPAASDARSAQRAQQSVRIPSSRLDQLMKLVGELVINQSRLQQAHTKRDTTELAGPVEAMERLISELRESVFSIRMMPIGPTFHKFRRVARDLSAQLGKDIELFTEGDDTPVDKTVLDQIGEPLMHLVRNSMDHGIELPAERVAKGKSPTGRVTLAAAHDGDHVVITIRDDGKGLDAAAIRAKAEEKGLIEPGAHLSEADTFDLIMRPGFSTAQTVTEVSGRGVGMDVVKKIIESLRGAIRISSTPGAGTTIRLSLPLTLAIIDGLLVRVDCDYFILPMASVLENVELLRSERLSCNGRNAIPVRGELVPYLRLRELFSVDAPEQDIERVVIVSVAGERLGLVVDAVIGAHQTVIQPMGPFYRDIELFSGTTIMGDGRVVMIIDVAATLRHSDRTAAAQTLH